MKFNTLLKVCAPAVALLAMSLPASAALINANGDFAISFSGNLSYAPGSPSPLLSATSVTLPTNTLTRGERVSGLDETYLSHHNDFCNVGDCVAAGPTPVFIGDTISLNNQTLDLTGVLLPTLTFSSGSSPANRFTFTANGIIVARSHVGNADFLNVYYSGLFNDSSNGYLPNEAASLSFAFTQVGGATGSVAGSGTFATPPQAPPPTGSTPEPATMSLFGSALVGVGLIGRKRLAR